MERKEFLEVYHRVKGNLERLDYDSRQYGYLQGCLYTTEEWDLDDVTLTRATEDESCEEEYHLLTDNIIGDNEDCYDSEIDGDIEDGGWELSPNKLYRVYDRKNTYSTRLDFYNNEVERGCDDWLEPYGYGDYYVTDDNLNVKRIYILSHKES
jgi:hypothetical protein